MLHPFGGAPQLLSLCGATARKSGEISRALGSHPQTLTDHGFAEGLVDTESEGAAPKPTASASVGARTLRARLGAGSPVAVTPS